MKIKSTLEYVSFLVIFLAVSVRYLIGLKSPQCLSIAPGYEPDDFAVIGLMSKHVLEKGEFPFFFWGQDWFGGLEAFMHGVAFWVFGITPWAMRVTPMFLYVLFCALTYLIARDMFNEKVGFFAVLWCAVAPLKISHLSIVPHTHYMETAVLGSLLLWITIRLILTHSARQRQFLYVMLGFFSGLSWWVTPLIVYYLAGISLFLLSKKWTEALYNGFIFALPAFVTGALPYIIFYARNPYSEIFGMQNGFRLNYFFKGLWRILTFGAPYALDVFKYERFGSGFPWLAAGFLISILVYFVVNAEGPEVVKSLLGRSTLNSPRGLITFTLLATIVVCSFSRYAAVEGLRPRYLMTLYSLYPIFFAYSVWEVSRKLRLLTLPLGAVFLFAQGALIWAWAVHEVPAFARRTDQILPVIDLIKSKGQKTCYTDFGGEEYTFLAKEIIIFCPLMRARYRPYEMLLDADDRPAFLFRQTDYFGPVLKLIGGSCKHEAAGNREFYYDFREPPWQYRQIDVHSIELSATHETTSIMNVLDRDWETSWISLEAGRSGMSVTFDLGKEYTLGLLRLWNPGVRQRYHPQVVGVDVSRDGVAWQEAVPRSNASFFNWSGPRLYPWEWGSPWEVRFGPARARFFRIKLFENSDPSWARPKAYPWLIQEAYVYEIVREGALGRDGESEIIRQIRELKLDCVYANRWMSTKIREAGKGFVDTIEEFTFLRDAKGEFVGKRLVRWGPKTGFVLEDADADAFEKQTREEGIRLKKEGFGRWVLFYFETAADVDESIKGNEGWWWTGLGIIKTNNKKTSEYLRKRGELEETGGKRQEAVFFYRKALERYQNNQKARKGIIRVLKKSGNLALAQEEENILLDETQPRHPCLILFDREIEFVGYTLDKDQVKPGESVHANYYWRITKGPISKVGVFVHVEGQGKLIQGDHVFLNRVRGVWPPLEDEVYSQEELIHIPDNAPAGDYQLGIGLFDLGSGKRYGVKKTNLPCQKNRVNIGKLLITHA